MSTQNLIPSLPILMTSQEIAKLTGKLHHHVLRDIRLMLVQLYGGSPEDYAPDFLLKNQEKPFLVSEMALVQSGTNHAGVPIYAFHLDRKHTYCLMTGYNAASRMRIIKRWQDLEAVAVQPVILPLDSHHLSPMQWIDLLTQVAELAKQTETERLAETAAKDAAEQQLATVQPKAEALDLIATATDGAVLITVAAKLLGVPPQKFFLWLYEHAWIYRRGNRWVAFQSRMKRGWLEHKLQSFSTPDGGVKTFVDQTLITPKGLAVLAERFAREGFIMLSEQPHLATLQSEQNKAILPSAKKPKGQKKPLKKWSNIGSPINWMPW